MSEYTDESILNCFDDIAHDNLKVVREDGTPYVQCLACGALWSVHECSGPEAYVFDELESGDESCLDEEDTVPCVACGEDFDRDDVSETGAGDYICDDCHEEEQEEEERQKWEDENTPTEGDLWTDDDVNFWIVGGGSGFRRIDEAQGRGLAFRVEPNRSVREAFDNWCEENQFYPNVWVSEERGGFHLYDWSNEVPF